VVPEAAEFDFNSTVVARSYDEVLVPALFEPWAARLLDEHTEWMGKSVLDLATGTGVVAQLVAGRVGADGRVWATDVNLEMLRVARRRCRRSRPRVTFVESAAAPLAVADATMDLVVCHQGFQFFPDRVRAAGEIRRILKNDGRALVSTWCSISECEVFAAVSRALETIEEPGLAARMLPPFVLAESELAGPFEEAGFDDVVVASRSRELVLENGGLHAVQVAYATPIGPGLRELTAEKQARFRKELIRLVGELDSDPVKMGAMSTHVLTAVRGESG
jgi:SAM-dependent methyltransferase